MCSHVHANKEEGAPSQFTPHTHTHLSFRMGLSCWWGRAKGGGKELKAGPRLEVVAPEGAQGRSQV